MVFLIKLKPIYSSNPQHYNNCSAPTFLILFKKLLAKSPFKKEDRIYVFYMRDYKRETIKLLPFLMTNFLFTELKSHNIWRKLKNCMIYLISQITFIFLTNIYYNMNFITSSSISPQDFPGTLGSIFADYFWRTFFLAHQKCIFLNISAKLVLKN